MRTKPYTESGIKRVPCLRCGKPSKSQWQICCLDNTYLGLCQSCDIGLNKAVLQFIGMPEYQIEQIMGKYIDKKNKEGLE